MQINLQPGSVQSIQRPRENRTSSSFGKQMFRLGKAVVFVLAVAAVLIVKTHLRQRIDDTDEKIRAEKREITRTRHAIDCCNIRIAQLTDWTHISKQIAFFDLKLRPQQGQVRMITLRNGASNDIRFASWLKSNRTFPGMTATR
ncbi:MAG: hypothetical protein MJ016_01650 [Victivallaceae bacterium]|nr:hypothetical protein [Victivallaceae bacterium]